MRDRIRAGVLATALTLLLAPGPASAQENRPAALDRVADHIGERMASEGIPSVAVAAARDGEVVWEEAFGWADREARRPATAHTSYSLASISKPITATGLMTLVEDGRIDLSAPVNRYLERSRLQGFAGDASGATVRRVLSHSAGLPLHYHFFYRDEPPGPPPMEETIRRYGRLVFPPGERFQYSNLGYGVLDHLLALVSGRDYATWIRTRVFVPLGMNRTSVGLTDRLDPFAATRYAAETREPIRPYRFDHDGASAVWSSAHDLLRFALFHLGHRPEGAAGILTAESRREMQRSATPDGADTRYGLGWSVEEELGYRKISHTGSMPGVSTMLALFPEEDVAVVVLVNTRADELIFDVQRRIAAALIPGYEQAWREAARQDTTREEDEKRDGGRAPAFDPPEELVGSWTGTLHTWQEELPVRLEIRGDGDVHARVGNQLETVVNGAELEDGVLSGALWGHVPTPDVMRHPLHRLQLELLVRGRRIHGQLTAVSTTAPTRYALSSYLELRRR